MTDATEAERGQPMSAYIDYIGPHPIDYVVALVALVCAGDQGLRSAAFSDAASSLKHISEQVRLAGLTEFYFNELIYAGERMHGFKHHYSLRR